MVLACGGAGLSAGGVSEKEQGLCRDGVSRTCWGLGALRSGQTPRTRAKERGRGVIPEVEVFEGELSLDDTRSLDTRAQHVLLRGHVAWGYQALQVGEVAAGDRGVWVGWAEGCGRAPPAPSEPPLRPPRLRSH